MITYLVLSLISWLYYKRSLSATLVEWYLKLTSKKRDNKVLVNLDKYDNIQYLIPKRLGLQKKVKEYYYQGMQLYVFNADIISNEVIIYLHGGAYVRNPRYFHMRFLKKLSKNQKKPIVVPIYPKIPKSSVLKAYDVLMNLYIELLGKFKHIYMMGDSSGGGLALGMCEEMINQNIKQPDELILLSPWVDISLDNQLISKYQKVEPLISVNNTRFYGKYWAQDLDVNDYRVSPIYGNMIGLGRVSIFVGTREILYPDNMTLYYLLKDSNVDVTLHEGKGLNHVYPIYPICEARKAFKQIINILERRKINETICNNH